MKTIVVIHQNDGTDVRIGKICRSLSPHCKLVFLGWNKSNTTPKPELGNTSQFLFRWQTKNGRATSWGLLGFCFWTLIQLHKNKPEIVYCVNEDLSAFLGIFKKPLKYWLICDIFDPIYDRRSKSKFSALFKGIQNIGRKFADKLIVTDKNRLERIEKTHQTKAEVIENFPETQATPVLPHFNKDANHVYIAFVGSLSQKRGVDHLTRCLDKLPNLRILCAGWIYDEVAENFTKKENVHYFGVVSAAESRGIMAISDSVFCIYDPSIANNINASPNKIYDAVSVGRPTLINSEILVSKFVTNNHLGITYQYDDINSLFHALETQKTISKKDSERLIDLSRQKFSWESQEEKLLALTLKNTSK